jgi:hypothetical protein
MKSQKRDTATAGSFSARTLAGRREHPMKFPEMIRSWSCTLEKYEK